MRNASTVTPVAAATCPIRITPVCDRLGPEASVGDKLRRDRVSKSAGLRGVDPEVRYTVDNGAVIVELRSVPDCPNLEPVREALSEALADLGCLATVVERVGDYPSPSVLINDVDVMGAATRDAAACRLDVPTADNIRDALAEAMTSTRNPQGGDP